MARKVRITANELTDVDASYVSMVKRGANRIPFRLLKSQEGNTMKSGQNNLDLGTLFKGEVPAKTPRVEALIVKSDVAAKTQEYLKSEGIEVFEVTEDTENSATILALKSDTDLTNVSIIKSDDSSALAVSEVQKSMVGYMGEESFLKNVTSGSFFPHLDFAAMALTDTVYNIMAKNDDKETVVNLINDSMDQFNTYVGGLVTALPSEVFSIAKTMKGLEAFEVPAPEGSSEAEESGVEKNEDGTDKGTNSNTPEVEKSETPDGEGGEKPTEQPVEKSEDGGEGEGTETPVEKSENGSGSFDMDAMKTLITEAVSGLETRLKADLKKMEDRTEALSTSVTKATTDAAKALETLGEDVVGGNTSVTDGAHERGVTKGEQPPTQGKMPSNVEVY